ncbi:hypothetical protein AVP42_00752 [Agromyces sp. NDB4Y10]|uniref:hypothetical protein n=1 Tax=Agromyces sp. NDB4Y10 TaxID=1775951 RepID=UPI0007B27B4E|nr:hypothetical protein [Agromyces sp. NDB4Y10]KZE94825.1 hypothetical protein AVP42_00752 [Agromyces sp. NDB4Y10]
MPETTVQPPAHLSTLAGATLFHRARILLGTAVGAAVAYGLLTNASRGSCTSDAFPEGGAEVTTCTTITLMPSAVVYLAMALVVMRAMTIVLQYSQTQDAAMRTLARARTLVVAIAMGSTVLAHAWFAAIPFEPGPPPTTGDGILPILIAWVELDTTTP